MLTSLQEQVPKPGSTPASSPNYFANSEVAARYVSSRPFFQGEVVERIRRVTGVQRFRRALDVGCGSGQSSVALASLADHVIAIDPSESMLEHAPRHPRITYQLGFAEQLNFSAADFDLVSVGSALHWFDQDRFFAQCRNVMAPDGVLAVYNDHFTAHMQQTVACKRWMRTRFAKRFRAPRRGMRDMDEPKAARYELSVTHRSSFDHPVPFSREEFITYLLTRSNTLAAIQSGKETHQSVVDWLDHELTPILPDGLTGSFIFKCNLWLMQIKAASNTAPRA
jgi:ubiquinone/menaquinone biosynthesis C-methylase UbiE